MGVFHEVVGILLLVLFNGLLSLSEMSIVSSRKTRLKSKADEGRYNYRLALHTAENPGVFLSTIQIGITLVGILAGAIGGATIADNVAGYFRDLPATAPYAKALGIAVVVLATTFVSVVVGELVPKNIALNRPEPIAAAIIIPVTAIGVFLKPLVVILSGTTNLLLALLGVNRRREPEVTEEDVKGLIDEGAQAGVFLETEKQMVNNVLYLGDQRIGSLMTHRVDIVYLEISDTKEDVFSRLMHNVEYSILPVCRGGLDHVIGFVRTKRVIAAFLKNTYTRIHDYVEKPLFLPESMNALRAMSALKQKNYHIAFVIDEYGGVEGLVSLSDLAFEVLGDINRATDADEPVITDRGDGSYLVDGLLPLKAFFAHFKLRVPVNQDYHTVAGFALERFGHIPRAGERFNWDRFRVEVVDMDGNRVDKLLVTEVAKPPGPPMLKYS